MNLILLYSRSISKHTAKESEVDSTESFTGVESVTLLANFDELVQIVAGNDVEFLKTRYDVFPFMFIS